MDGIVEGLCAMEVLEAQIACKTVALCFATVNQEFVFVIKPKPTIDTHAIFVVFHIFFIRFAGFQLTQKFKDETFVAIVIATGIATHDTRVKGSFIIVVSSIVKPHRSHHIGSRSHFFVRSFVRSSCLYAAKSRKSISILLRLYRFCHDHMEKKHFVFFFVKASS